MLFHTFTSQEERQKFGGSDFLELQICRLKRGTELEKIISCEAIEHWKSDSLYIHGDDTDKFDALYGKLFGNSYHGNGKRGVPDYFGINYYNREQTILIAKTLREEKPEDFQILLEWLTAAEKYNGFYLLGI